MTYFERPDPYAKVKLPAEQSLFSIDNDNIQLSAMYKDDNKKTVVVRLWNSSDKPQKTTVVFLGRRFKLTFRKKEIKLVKM
jgi:alpha-mannosidase